MDANFWISDLRFTNGTNLQLTENAIVVFVGPNNAGKSHALRELYQMTVSNNHTPHQLIEKVIVSVRGNGNEFISRIKNRQKGNQFYYQQQKNTGLQSLTAEQLTVSWESFQSKRVTGWPGSIPFFFCNQMNTAERLNLVNPPPTIDFMKSFPTHPIHMLKEDSDKEVKFSYYFKIAFGQDLIVNHGAGNTIPLHIGIKPIITIENDRVSTVYQQQLRQLPQLHEQGDGMKSFAGVFLGLFAQDYSINIIDEPEAFLHPPQAMLLGKMIAKDLAGQKQVFIATHSEHFLKGLLDTAADRLIVIRIQRDGVANKINVLENEDLQKIWQDSLLRHSNIIDGLFHKKVVISESDSDSRFYSAIATSIIDTKNLPAPDILFIQSGGKQRFPTVIRALKQLEVPLVVIGDFDLYHEEKPLMTMYEELDGNWQELKDDFLIVKKSIDKKRPELETSDLKNEIDLILSKVSERIIPDFSIKAIQTALKKSSPWSQAKSSGKAYLPPGDETKAFNKIQKKLREKNIIILEVGEVEAFCKTIGDHGPKWVNQVLERDIAIDPELENARKFVYDNILDVITV